eukprot:Clim_evm14s14 gene=Clim_evmTU14s14
MVVTRGKAHSEASWKTSGQDGRIANLVKEQAFPVPNGGMHPDVPGLYIFDYVVNEAEEKVIIKHLEQAKGTSMTLEEYVQAKNQQDSSLGIPIVPAFGDGLSDEEGKTSEPESSPPPIKKRKLLRGRKQDADEKDWEASEVYQNPATRAPLASGRFIKNFGPEVIKPSGMSCSQLTGILPDLPSYSDELNARVLKCMKSVKSNVKRKDYSFQYLQGNKYVSEDGHWVDFHVDETGKFGPAIAVISLGHDSKLFMRPKGNPRETITINLPRRSLYVMTGISRYYWEHCIPTNNIKGTRISVVLRSLTPENIRKVPRTMEDLAELSGTGSLNSPQRALTTSKPSWRQILTT